MRPAFFIVGTFVFALVLVAKDKPRIDLKVVDTQTSEKEYMQYVPGTPAKSTTNCDSSATVYGGGGIATGNGTTNCTTTTTPGTAPTTVRRSIEQAHVRAIMPDGRRVTLWCQQGFRRCSNLSPGTYTTELDGNSVWIEVFELDGVKKHKIKYRFEGGW